MHCDSAQQAAHRCSTNVDAHCKHMQMLTNGADM
jgi:hypothetical protein